MYQYRYISGDKYTIPYIYEMYHGMHKISKIREAGYGVNGNFLHYLCNISVNLNLF